MVNNIEVILFDQAGTKYDVGYIDEIPLSLNQMIADVRQPDKRNSTFSKTINFPGSAQMDIFFEMIWETNISLQSFNPNLKCPIIYYVNSVEQFRGDLQLLKVVVNDETGETNYECSATGRLGTLFVAFGDALLTDLDLSEYDHDLTKANVTDSWATQIQVSGSPQPFALGVGYTYGLINYGLNQVNGETEYHVKYLRPQVYKKTLWDKCFAYAGKTYTSSDINSTYFKSQVIPSTEEKFLLSQTDIDNSQFFTRRSSNQAGTVANCNPLFSGWISDPGLTTVIFNDDSSTGYYDTGGQYNTGTGEFTVGTTNFYDQQTIINYDLTFTNSTGTATNAQLTVGNIDVYIEKLIGATWTIQAIGSDYTLVPLNMPTLSTTNHQVSVQWLGINLVAGEKYRVRVGFNAFQFNLLTAGMVLVTTGTTTAQLTVRTDSTWNVALQSNVITEGYLVEMNQVIPSNIKIVDWIMTEFKANNFYMDIDKSNENNFIIESRENFYSGEVDYTLKRDYGKPREVSPMGELDWKRYDYVYKTDADEYNQRYFDTYKEPYGSGYYEVTNDFLKNKNKLELLYAATPIVDNSFNGLILPKLWKNDNGTIKQFKALPRSLYYGGVINLSYGSWTLKSASGDTVYTTYPFVGDCDNPYNPTVTLNWETPKAVYYNYLLATYTDNNLKNRAYSRFINQITDKNSKIEKRWYNLTAIDIEEFDFRKVIFDTDAYFVCNGILNYDPQKEQSTQLELLKLADYDAFTPNNNMAAPPPIGSEINRIINGNYSNGINNTNLGNASHIVGGSGNFIGAGATNVQLRNCTNVVVAGDVVDFIGDGLSNRVINSNESGNVAKQNNATITLTSDTTLDASYNEKVILLNASSDFTVTFDSANMSDCRIYFKRIDGSGSNIYFTDLDTGVTIDGAAVPVILMPATYDKMTIGISTDIYIL